MLDRLTVDSPQLEVGLLPELATEAQLSAFRHHGVFEPMDSHADYLRLNAMEDAGMLDWTSGDPVVLR